MPGFSGKPHPRWAEPNFCDGDATEKWHSRSSRRTQAQFARQRREFQEGGGQIDGANVSPVIKVEQDATQRHLYRLSQSPPSLNSHPQHTPGNCSPSDNSSLCSYPSSGSGVEYNNTRQNGTSLSMSNNNDLYYPQPYIRPSDASPVQPSCTCLTNPAAGHPLIALTHQLQSTMEILRQLPEHANRNQCLMMKRITDLNDMMQYVTLIDYRFITQTDRPPTVVERQKSSSSNNTMHSLLQLRANCCLPFRHQVTQASQPRCNQIGLQ